LWLCNLRLIYTFFWVQLHIFLIDAFAGRKKKSIFTYYFSILVQLHIFLIDAFAGIFFLYLLIIFQVQYNIIYYFVNFKFSYLLPRKGYD